MSPLEVRADHTLRVSIRCGRCNSSRSLRVGAIPRRWQAVTLEMIPFRCLACGERPNRIIVERGWQAQYQLVWEWRLAGGEHPAGA